MKTINGSYTGDLVINEETEILGSIIGSVEVIAPFLLSLKGSINGNLVVRKNAQAEVRGTVNGTLINESGKVDIWGYVNKLQDKDQNLPAVIHPKAVVNERI